MHSHHSHSGDYVAHGVDPLEDIVAQVVKMKFHTYCLTEHMPRINEKYLYPEEEEGFSSRAEALDNLTDNFSKFLEHAQTIKNRPNEFGTKFIIGIEVESCDIDHINFSKRFIEKHSDVIQFCVGSVHHVYEIPIDFDQEAWDRSLAAAGNNLQKFLVEYYDVQYKMLTALRPLVVAHMDLYKLFLSDDLKVNPNTGECGQDGVPFASFSYVKQWKPVRDALIRNLAFVNSYGGAIEISTSALRKKLKEPYPGKDICKLVEEHCDGRFVLSDDAHGVSHVGTCYDQGLKYIMDVLHLKKMYYVSESENNVAVVRSIPIEEFKANVFWKNNYTLDI